MKVKTTIKVDKEVVSRLHGIKGHLNYLNPPKKHDLNDALIMLVDEYYKKNQSELPPLKL